MVLPCCRWDGDTLLLEVRVQPRASRDELVGIQGGRLKIRITAPPVEGAANDHLLRLIARAFDTPRARIRLVKGQTGRDKRLAIDAPARLPSCLDGQQD